MKLYVIRHGLTKCNVEKRYNGKYLLVQEAKKKCCYCNE